MKFSLALASLSSLLPVVLAHGSMTTLIVDGTSYTGPLPNGDKIDSVIRQINSIDPVTDLTSDDMSCGHGAADVTATKMAAAKPGSNITVAWISGSPPTLWPHVVGPLQTYIAACGGDCADFNSVNAKWVKIDEASKVSGNTVAGSGWVQEATFHAGKTYSMKLPDDIPNGNYLLRHEIIALHNAQSVGGAEVYPACSQITVSGGSSGSISTKTAVAFPGAYDSKDPGILVDVYSPPFGQYQFPGGSVVTALTTGATEAANTNDADPSSSSSSSSGSSGSGGSSNNTTSSSSSSLMATTTSKPAATPTPTKGAAAANNNSNSTSSAGSAGDDPDCNDDGSDDTDDSTVTITETVYITASRSHHVHTATATAFVTITPDAASSSSASASSASATPANLDSGYPKRRSRIMARHHFASLH